jgi:hypothetical protein
VRTAGANFVQNASHTGDAMTTITPENNKALPGEDGQ